MVAFRNSFGLNFDDVLLVPKKSSIKSRSEVILVTQLTENILLDTPVIGANMDTISSLEMIETMDKYGATCFLHRYQEENRVAGQIEYLKDIGVKPIVPSIGFKTTSEAITQYIEKGATALCIDVAHGHTEEIVKYIQSIHYPIDIIAGNVATPEAAVELAIAGASAVKVGIGPGYVCTTRINTGVGYPQLSAIIEIKQALKSFPKVKIIADGGIRTVGDIAKALAAGADSVMSGYLFAGCTETGFTEYRGMAGAKAQQEFKGFAKNIEGKEIQVDSKGSVKNVLKQIREGLQSAFSYCNAFNLHAFRENAEFVILH